MGDQSYAMWFFCCGCVGGVGAATHRDHMDVHREILFPLFFLFLCSVKSQNKHLYNSESWLLIP